MFGKKSGQPSKSAKNEAMKKERPPKEPSGWTREGRRARRAAKEEAAKRQNFTMAIKALRWFLVIFFVSGALTYMPSIGSFALIAAGLLVAPIQPVQDFFKQHLQKRWMLPTLVVVLFFVGVGTSNGLQHTSPSIPTPSETMQNPTKNPLDEDGVVVSQQVATESIDASESTPTPTDAVTPLPSDSQAPTPSVLPEDSSFEVHFIDVGQADSALVLCDGHSMLIDGGNAADSDLVYTYLKQNHVDHLDYVVCTHGHEDHVGGLAGALNYATVDVAYCSVTDYDSKAFSSFVKYLGKQNVSITVPEAGNTFPLGSSEVAILGPIHDSDDTNNQSLVLRIVYGETSFLFTGDAEREEEQDILNAGYILSSTVLKVGHHGSANSTTYPFLREIAPKYAVISVGSDNSYGHPTEDTLSRLRDADVKVYRTDMQGDVICTSDGKEVVFRVEKNSDADTLAVVGGGTQKENDAVPTPDPTPSPTPEKENTPSGTTYVLNTNTRKFHYPGCSSVKKMKESNKSYYTGNRDEVIAMGYSPCGNCHP